MLLPLYLIKNPNGSIEMSEFRPEMHRKYNDYFKLTITYYENLMDFEYISIFNEMPLDHEIVKKVIKKAAKKTVVKKVAAKKAVKKTTAKKKARR